MLLAGPGATLWHPLQVKNTILGYIALLAVAGLVSLGVLGATMMQRHDGRGITVLALLVGGLVLTFIHGLRGGKSTRTSSPSVARSPQLRTVTLDAAAEFAQAPGIVWSLIRPSDSPLSYSDGVYHAMSVPGVPDGPGERQCFFHINGRIGVLEVTE